MTINPIALYRLCDPSDTINYADPEERKYYIDFSDVRSGQVMGEMRYYITWADKPTCQLFTGHIWCGKSTETHGLKALLEGATKVLRTKVDFKFESFAIFGSPYKTMRVNKINRLHISPQNRDLIKSIRCARLLHAF